MTAEIVRPDLNTYRVFKTADQSIVQRIAREFDILGQLDTEGLKTGSDAVTRSEHHHDQQQRRGDSNRPVVDIITITDSINTDFTLIKERPSSGGAYEITTRHSRRAPVRPEVVDAPADSTLRLFLKNMRGPLEVYLHPTYQGKLSSEALITETLGWVSIGTLRIRLEMTGRGTGSAFGVDGASRLASNASCLERCG